MGDRLWYHARFGMTIQSTLGADFREVLRGLIAVHHSIYPLVPPQGIYFEALVERAFKRTRKPFSWIEPGGRNLPRHDLLVEGTRLSLKTETGRGTDPDQILITKLCTTEKEPWAAEDLIQRVVAHLSRYDFILMLRAIWRLPVIKYQLLEVPVDLLRLVKTASLMPVGRRKGRQSFGADILAAGQCVYHVHFDAADGKCQIRNLPVSSCVRIDEWEIQVTD